MSERARGWLRSTGYADPGYADIPDKLYQDILEEVQAQHPEDAQDWVEDRAAFRALTHPEWKPRPKVGQRRDYGRALFILWAVAILLLLFWLAVRSAHGQDKPRSRLTWEGQGSEPVRAERLEPKKPLVPGPAPVDPPVLTSDQKFRLRDLQHKYDELRLQMAKVELDKVKLERELSKALSDLNGVAYDLARESKVDTARFNLNIDTLVWEQRK